MTEVLCSKTDFERRRFNATCRSGSAFCNNSDYCCLGDHIVRAVDLQLLQELANKARETLRLREASLRFENWVRKGEGRIPAKLRILLAFIGRKAFNYIDEENRCQDKNDKRRNASVLLGDQEVMTHFDRIETNPPMSQMTADSRDGQTHPIIGAAMEVHRQLSPGSNVLCFLICAHLCNLRTRP